MLVHTRRLIWPGKDTDDGERENDRRTGLDCECMQHRDMTHPRSQTRVVSIPHKAIRAGFVSRFVDPRVSPSSYLLEPFPCIIIIMMKGLSKFGLTTKS